MDEWGRALQQVKGDHGGHRRAFMTALMIHTSTNMPTTTRTMLPIIGSGVLDCVLFSLFGRLKEEG